MVDTAEGSKQGASKYAEWLDRLPQYARRTTQGNVVLSLKVNVNRAGHGYLSYLTDEGKADQVAQPVADVEQAVRAVRDAWARAEGLANTPRGGEGSVEQ